MESSSPPPTQESQDTPVRGTVSSESSEPSQSAPSDSNRAKRNKSTMSHGGSRRIPQPPMPSSVMSSQQSLSHRTSGSVSCTNDLLEEQIRVHFLDIRSIFILDLSSPMAYPSSAPDSPTPMTVEEQRSTRRIPPGHSIGSSDHAAASDAFPGSSALFPDMRSPK